MNNGEQTPRYQSPETASGLEPLGDPDDDSPDFAEEHQQFVVDADDPDGEEFESTGYAGGLKGGGPP